MSRAMTCPCCRKDIDPRASWKGRSEQFYCSEFCAEVETADIVHAPFEQHAAAQPRA